MKGLIIMLALLLAISSGFAADQDVSKEPPKGPEATEAPKGPAQKVPQEKKTPQWPRPYQPTEEISADSTVPFPTDI